jgi:hypothetical protein
MAWFQVRQVCLPHVPCPLSLLCATLTETLSFLYVIVDRFIL